MSRVPSAAILYRESNRESLLSRSFNPDGPQAIRELAANNVASILGQ